MSRYEKQMILQDTKYMKLFQFLMIALFAIVFFFSFAIPALKNTYGTTHIVSMNFVDRY